MAIVSDLALKTQTWLLQIFRDIDLKVSVVVAMAVVPHIDLVQTDCTRFLFKVLPLTIWSQFCQLAKYCIS